MLTLSDATPVDLTPVDLTPAFESVNDLRDVAAAQLLDGVTEDGQAVVRNDRNGQNRASLMLVDLATGAENPLPEIPGPISYLVEANDEHIVYSAEKLLAGAERQTEARSLVLDLASETWHAMRWPGLPVGTTLGQDIGPDGRLYVAVSDADALASEGQTGELWSVSLTDPDDVRNEDLAVGAFAIDDNHLVWGERRYGISNRLTVRDLETGDETSFDSQSGAHCIQNSLGVDAGRIVLIQSCGTQAGVTDDRVQVVSMTGEPVVTIRGDSVMGHVDEGGHVNITANEVTEGKFPDTNGVYSYDLTTGDFLRVSTSTSSVGYALQGPVSDGWLMWMEGQPGDEGWVQKIAQAP